MRAWNGSSELRISRKREFSEAYVRFIFLVAAGMESITINFYAAMETSGMAMGHLKRRTCHALLRNPRRSSLLLRQSLTRSKNSTKVETGGAQCATRRIADS
jgi:hypothetical protein